MPQDEKTQIETNLSEGGVFKNLIVFAVPFLISNIIQSMYNVADMLIVGNYAGRESMSGVNIGGQVTFILTQAVVGLCIGATVLIGQYIGANKRKELKQVISTIITLLVIISIAITTLMLVFKDNVLRLMQTPEESFSESSAYLTVTVIGIIFIFSYNAFAGILRGMGNSRHPLYFVLIACVTNIVLDFVFVAGLQMGALGAAVATVISQALSVILCVSYMIRSNFPFNFRLKSYKLYRSQLRLIFKIGLPTLSQNTIISLSFMFLTAIINIIGGVTASAAVGAVSKFNSFVFMPVVAIASSVSTIAAQNIGAGKLDRAVHTTKLGLILAVVVSFAFFAVCRVFPEEILRLFGDDPDVIAVGAEYLLAMSYDFLIIPFTFCLNSLFIAGGHTNFTFINSIIASIIIRVPMTYLLGQYWGYGITGAGLAIPIATGGAFIMILLFLASGRWKVNVVKTRQ